MHSSRMRTVRCSDRHLVGSVCLGGCLPGEMSAQRGCLPDPDPPGGRPPPQMLVMTYDACCLAESQPPAAPPPWTE